MFNKKLLLIFCTIFLIGISFVSAVQTVIDIQVLDQGITIEYPKFTTIKQNQEFNLRFHAFNSSDGKVLTNVTTNCTLNIYNHSGKNVLRLVSTFDQLSAEDCQNCFEVEILKGNFSQIDVFAYLIRCENNNSGGAVSGNFEVTESGVELTESSAIFSIGLLAILVLFLFISLFSLFNFENYIAKFSLYLVSHVLIILISFVGWQIGVEAILGGMALTGIFRIFFWIFTLSLFPMIILSIVWIFYIHTFNEHFQKLIDKGEDTETAFRLTKKKRGGWFDGK